MGGLYSREQLNSLHDKHLVQHYFLYLAQKGVVEYLWRTPTHLYFRTPTGKYAVSPVFFYEFKQGLGGSIVRAVMQLEKKTFYQAVTFLFQEFCPEAEMVLPERASRTSGKEYRGVKPLMLLERPVQNAALTRYYMERGISIYTLRRYAREVHLRYLDRFHIALGLINHCGGWDLRSRHIKIKCGPTGLSSVGAKHPKVVVVVEGMVDLLSYIDLFYPRKLPRGMRVVSLNSVGNAGKFVEIYGSGTAPVLLALDKDAAGDKATEKLLQQLGPRARDLRDELGIGKKGCTDVNELLMLLIAQGCRIPK